LPSLHAAPSAFAGFEHVPVAVSHVPAIWHWSEAVHVIADPVHVPAWHVSDVVQAFPSLQTVPFIFGALTHCPVVESHVLMWHWSEALHTTGFVPVHTPAWQV
jgi:hypothetical protein